MRLFRCTVVGGLLAIGCSLTQATVDSGIELPDTGDDGSGDGTTGQSGPTSDGADESTSGGDGGGCHGDPDCPAGQACVGGLCIGDMCPDGETCDPGETCRVGQIDCSGAQAQCVTVGNAAPGTICDAGFVCDINGGCVACVDGAQCQAQAECSVGTLECGDGDPVCTPSGWAPEGTPCSDGRYCNDTGVCLTALDCAAVHTFDPTAVTGIYPIDPDGPGGAMPFTAYCDFDTGGGAWSLWNSADVDTLPSNATMPRCSGTTSTDCFAGTFAGRGDAPGLYRVTGFIEHLEDDLGWTTVDATQEHLGDCNATGATCMAGDQHCLFSFLGEGSDCCTATNMNNMCLQ